MDLTSLASEVPDLFKSVPPSSLSALLSTDRKLRSHIHDIVSSISLQSKEDIHLLISQKRICLRQLCVTQPLPDTAMAQLSSHPWPGIVSLNFHGARLAVSALRLLAAGSWTRLQYLNLTDSNLRSKGMAALKRGEWPQLKTLILSRCNLNLPSIRHLTAALWHQLEYLKLSENLLTTASVAQLSKGPWPQLKKIDLYCTLMTSVRESHGRISGLIDGDCHPAYIQHLIQADWPKLSQLKLCGSMLAYDSIKMLTSTWPDMQELDLSTQDLCERCYGLIGEARWPLLSRLNVSATEIDAGGMAGLVEGNFPLLSSLDISCNSTIDTAALSIMAKGNWPLLGKLCLRGIAIGPAGMAELVKANWPRLRLLDMASRGMSVEVVRVLISGRWPLLACLVLGRDACTDAVCCLLSPASAAQLRPGDNVIDNPAMVADGCWPNLRKLCFLESGQESRWFAHPEGSDVEDI